MSRDCEDCPTTFTPPAAQAGWSKVRCSACSALRAATRALHALAAEDGRLLPLSAAQARRLRPYLDACGAIYARWDRAWAFPSLETLRLFREAALTPSGRASRIAERRLQSAGILPGAVFICARSTDRAEGAA